MALCLTKPPSAESNFVWGQVVEPFTAIDVTLRLWSALETSANSPAERLLEWQRPKGDGKDKFLAIFDAGSCADCRMTISLLPIRKPIMEGEALFLGALGSDRCGG
jgi:hypothetical protein